MNPISPWVLLARMEVARRETRHHLDLIHRQIATRAERLAVTRIDALFDTTPDGLTFAHELAHLAERVLPLRLKLELARLYDEAQSHEHAFEQYSLRNVHEFFAVHATHALTRRLGRPLNLEFDADGQLKRVLDFFDEVRRG